MKPYLTFISLLLLCSCSGTFKSNLNFNPDEPLRVAVVPFVSVDAHGQMMQQEGRLLVDNLSLISTEVEQTPPQVVRKFVISELKKTNLDLVSTALIDVDLPHHGYSLPDGSLDINKVLGTSAKDFCQSFLSCDAVLYGTIKEWDRSYYGLQSVNSVDIVLKLVSAKTGVILFEGEGEDSTSRGITKGPTGISDLILEPIKGLDSEYINTLAHNTVEKILEPLVTKNRAHFLANIPPVIFATSHDGSVSRAKPLIVVMYGSENGEASFSIGDAIQNLPMLERSPGHYYGEYLPLENDSFLDQDVTVNLKDGIGRKSTIVISKQPISYQH